MKKIKIKKEKLDKVVRILVYSIPFILIIIGIVICSLDDVVLGITLIVSGTILFLPVYEPWNWFFELERKPKGGIYD